MRLNWRGSNLEARSKSGLSGHDNIADFGQQMQYPAVSNQNLDLFRSLLADIKAALPPAPLQVVRHLVDLDLNFVYAEDPELIVDLVLKIRADSILACYGMVGAAQTDYLRTLRLISLKINAIAIKETSNFELVTYLREFDSQLDEFGI